MDATAKKPRDIFIAAVKLTPDNWDGYLAQACGDDSALRGRVKKLLAAHLAAGSFLAAPASGVDVTEQDAIQERPGTVIGPYKLLEQIGEGGFGVVFMAEQQQPVRRKVALKVIKPGMDTRQVVARFEAERQALAMMDHPNIAKVFDAGRTRGRETGRQGDRETGRPGDKTGRPGDKTGRQGDRETGRQGDRETGRQEDREIGKPEGKDPSWVSSSPCLPVSLSPGLPVSPTPSQTVLSDPGRPYFVMELIQGVPITTYCDEHQLTTRQRLELFGPVCQAVQHAHQKGIIHRDLKPSNVLVTLHDGKPVVKVIDFGIAKAIGQQLTDKTLFTNFAHMIGTPLYMSPEQAEMSGLDIDTRSDIYALGVLLYELLTGTTPFDKERLQRAGYDEIRRLIREEEPPKPSTRLSELSRSRAPSGTEGATGPARLAGPTSSVESIAANRRSDPAKLSRLCRGDLDWIVMKCLEKDRQRRYETASGLARDIERYLYDDPVEACPPSVGYRFRKLVRRNKAILTTTALVAVALLLGTGISIWQVIRATEAEDRAEKGWEAEKIERHRTASAERKAKERLFEAKVSQAEASQWSGRHGQRFTSLAALAEAAELIPTLDLGPAALLDLRTRAIVSLTRADLRPAPTHPPHRIAARVDLDGSCQRYIAWVRADFVAIHARDDERELLRLPNPGGSLRDSRFSRCGRYLAYQGWSGKARETRIWDLRDAKALVRVPNVCSVDFCPESKRAVVSLTDGSLRVYRLPDGAEIQQLPLKLGADARVRFQAGGGRVAVLNRVGRDVEALAIELETGRTVDRVAPPQLSLVHVDCHAHANLIALTCGSRIALWQPGSGKELMFLDGHQGSISSVAFDHRGSVVASAGSDATIRLWDSATGKQLVSFPATASNLRFSADDRLLAYVERAKGNVYKAVYLQVATGNECRLVRVHAGWPVFGLDCHPKGNWLASAAADGIRISDLECGKEIAFQKGNSAVPIAFDPADDTLVVPLRRAPVARRLAIREGAMGGEGGQLEVVGIGTGADDFRPLGQFLWWDASKHDHFHAAVSADGRWVVRGYESGMSRDKVVTRKGPSGGKGPPPFKLMLPTLSDRQTGAIQNLSVTSSDIQAAQVALSRDARLAVVASASSYSVWRVAPLKLHGVLERPQPSIDPAPVAFSPEGKMLAVALSQWDVKLIDAETLGEIVTLPAPERGVLTRLCFSPDGSRLVAGTRAGLIQVWDLRGLRRQLAEIDLDWKLQPWEPR